MKDRQNSIEDKQTRRGWARCSYENWLFLEPNVITQGLWECDGAFYVVVEGITEKTCSDDVCALTKKFNEQCRVICTPITLVSHPPMGAQQISGRTHQERIRIEGEPITRNGLIFTLGSDLPSDFPFFRVDDGAGFVQIIVQRELTPFELNRLKQISSRVIDLPLEIEVDTTLKERSVRSRRDGDIQLLPARYMNNRFAFAVHAAVREDEEFWCQNRIGVWTGALQDAAKVVGWEFDQTRCLINRSFLPDNLRLYLPMYDEIVLVMPIQSMFEQSLKGWNATEEELVALAAAGRLRFLLPQAIDRYPAHFVSALTEAAPDSVLMSRRLAAATIMRMRTIDPFLYPATEPETLHRLLNCLGTLAESKEQQEITKVVQEALGQHWVRCEHLLHFHGAMAAVLSGGSQVIAKILKHISGKDFAIEMCSAGSLWEWGFALDATIVPTHTKSYSEQALCEMISAIYSQPILMNETVKLEDPVVAVAGLLGMDNDAPLLEVASAFKRSDILHVRELIQKLARDPEAMEEAVSNFNDKIAAFDSRKSYHQVLDIVAATGALSFLEPSIGAIGFSAYLAKLLLYEMEVSGDSQSSRGVDWLRASVAKTHADVAMVSRLRRQFDNKS